MSNDVLVRAEGVAKKFSRDLMKSLWYGVTDTLGDLTGRDGTTDELRPSEFWALNDVSFELRRGECIGLVGRNGAGKTTLLKLLSGLIKPDNGRIEIGGRLGALIALGAGFNPVLSGRENIYVNASVLGLSRREINDKIADIIDFAEIDEFIDGPVQSYSSGMQVRLGFAVATAMRPDVLLLDEVLAVGDSAFRAKCFSRIGKILTNAAVIFVSHSEAQIYRICNRAILLSNGRLIKQGAPESVLATYRSGEGYVRPDQSIVADKSLINVQLVPNKKAIWYGEDLEICAVFETNSEIRIGGIFVHLWRNGEFVANGDIIFNSDDALRFGAGRSELTISLRSLNLPAGKYTVSFAAYDETRKKTIFHHLHFSEVEVQGPIGAGTPYLVPMTLTIGHGSESASSALHSLDLNVIKGG
jgi:homopolymeric O-antigen transport system ATP-binding protein